ncbi:HalOD1 output domain-containing protein [Natrinema sp. 1APR25-10V2]|uniref:HalOD1 output domain-containing protein n=1 Tax=Natrinema sp. 1APR25-10V2 TaxID=2951081 RepID=UPI002874D816|nr:HalOD1 output domain-containing protein [Natrinema sp. 1APR25-10V2]MDS0474839.1 hypothetical protein [Natrinema sp. 1APR25-10V2]
MTESNSRLSKLTREAPPHAVEYEYDTETPPSLAVVQAICVLEDIDPMEMPTEAGFVLHDHIDPSALDTILANSTGDGNTVISFEVAIENTYTVEVRDTGRLILHYDQRT